MLLFSEQTEAHKDKVRSSSAESQSYTRVISRRFRGKFQFPEANFFHVGSLKRGLSSDRGKSPSQAEISFLNKCKWLELYGVDMHFVKVCAFFVSFFFLSQVSACFPRLMRAEKRWFFSPFRAEMEENTPWVSLPPASWCLKAPTKSASSFGENGHFWFYKTS